MISTARGSDPKWCPDLSRPSKPHNQMITQGIQSSNQFKTRSHFSIQYQSVLDRVSGTGDAFFTVRRTSHDWVTRFSWDSARRPPKALSLPIYLSFVLFRILFVLLYFVFIVLSAPKVLLEDRWPMTATPSRPIHPSHLTYSSEWT